MSNKSAALLPLGIGIFVTLSLFGLAYLTAREGLLNLSYALYWQAWGLEHLLPCQSQTTPAIDAESGCEITRWHVIAFYAGLPLGVMVYSLLAYLGLLVFRRRRT